MADEDSGQLGNVPVIRIDEDDLGDLAALMGVEITGPDLPDEPGVHHVDLEMDDFESLLQRTLSEVAGPDTVPPQPARPAARKGGPPKLPKMPGQVQRPRPSQVQGHGAPPQGQGHGAPPQGQGHGAAQMNERQRGSEEARVVGELRARLTNLTAETDVYKKRLADEAAGARATGRADVCKQILPVLDAMELALRAARSNHDIEQLTRGLELMLKQFTGALNAMGLEEIPAEGAPFDPAHHEAFQQVRTGNVPPGAVAEVVRRGWRFNQRMLRAAQVIVEAPDPG